MTETELERHTVAVVVVVEAEGLDARDAHHVGFRAVKTAIDHAADLDRDHGAVDPGLLVYRTDDGQRRVATVLGVSPLGSAFREGLLRAEPNIRREGS
jgi:hypothetical protein